jgi:hypothetical protein
MNPICPNCKREFSGHRALSTHWKVCPTSKEQRFWVKVDTSGEGCWPYYRTDILGYGRFDKQGPLAFAHRAAWIFVNGPIPAGMDVCHTCDVRNCCNPKHLFLGTAADNSKDMYLKGRQGPNCKLNADAVREIRSSSLPNKALAQKYGVDYSAIWAVRSGRKWKHVDSPSGDGGEAV